MDRATMRCIARSIVVVLLLAPGLSHSQGKEVYVDPNQRSLVEVDGEGYVAVETIVFRDVGELRIGTLVNSSGDTRLGLVLVVRVKRSSVRNNLSDVFAAVAELPSSNPYLNRCLSTINYEESQLSPYSRGVSSPRTAQLERETLNADFIWANSSTSRGGGILNLSLEDVPVVFTVESVLRSGEVRFVDVDIVRRYLDGALYLAANRGRLPVDDAYGMICYYVHHHLDTVDWW